MKLDITAKIYNDEDAARSHLEEQLWPDGPFCPHCGNASPDRIKKLAANLKATVVIQHDARDIGKLPAFPAAAK